MNPISPESVPQLLAATIGATLGNQIQAAAEKQPDVAKAFFEYMKQDSSLAQRNPDLVKSMQQRFSKLYQQYTTAVTFPLRPNRSKSPIPSQFSLISTKTPNMQPSPSP